jgi:pilus assembly protein Flp/PilA
MNTMFLKLLVKMQELINREEGQDLVEYALLVSLIAIAAVASSKALGTGIASIFTTISTDIANAA